MDSGLDEMVRTFAWSPREAFVSGGPSVDSLPWDGLSKSKEDEQKRSFTFSRFALAVAARDYRFQITGDLERDCYTDGKYDRGLDGVVIAVDGQVIVEPAAVNNFNNIEKCSLRILFVQSKNSEFIDANDVSNFGTAVQSFLIEPQFLKGIGTNDVVARLWQTYDALRLRCGTTFSPDVTMGFAYHGDWRSSGFPNVRLARRAQLDNLRARFPQARFDLDPLDCDELSKASLRAGIAIARKLATLSLVDLPKETAASGYVGVVSARALLDAFSEDSGDGVTKKLDDHLFLENPRFFLGQDREDEWNVGAAALAETITENRQNTVLLCHNGINVVASSAWRDAADPKTLVLVTPQIINGCQSTYRMSNLRDKLSGVDVVVKIAVTRDDDLKDAIIRGSNTQEVVGDMDMLSRNRMIRELEKEFERASPDARLWLERRVNERKLWAEEDPGWEFDPDRIMTPRDLMDGFNSTVLGAPHDSHARLGTVLGRVSEKLTGTAVKIFALETEPAVYRAVAWLLFAARKWGRYKHMPWLDGPDDKENSGFWARHHFLYALFRIADNSPDAGARQDLVRGAAAQARFESLVGKLVERESRQSLTKLAGQAVEAADEAVHDYNKRNERNKIPMAQARRVGNAKFRDLIRVEADKRRPRA